MIARIGRRPFLVPPPAEFGWLHAFRQKTFDRPGVDEHVARLRALGALGVALRNMHALDAQALREARPLLLALRLRTFVAKILGEIDEPLLDEPGDHARIGAAARDGSRAARILAPFR